MPISENMVQEIVQEVMAKMQIADAPTGKQDRKSTRLNSSHTQKSRMPSSA